MDLNFFNVAVRWYQCLIYSLGIWGLTRLEGGCSNEEMKMNKAADYKPC
jgi:hypothetical protein